MMKNLLKEISLGFKAVRYGFQLKSNIAMVIIFFILGILSDIFCGGTALSYFGGIYMSIGAIVPMQLICSLGVSSIAKTSPKRKHMETFIPTACSTITMLVVYTVLVIIKGILCQLNPENAKVISSQLIAVGITCAVILIYCGVVYKHFVISMILLIGAMSIGGGYTGVMLATVDELEGGSSLLTANIPFSTSFGAATLAGYVLVLIGGFLCLLLTNLFYKHEMSKWAYGAALRKAMQ